MFPKIFRTQEFTEAFRRCGYPDATIDEILRGLSRRLTAFIRLRMPRCHAADVYDCVQKTIVRMLATMERFDPARNPWGWLFGIAARVVFETVRKARVERKRLREYAQTLSPFATADNTSDGEALTEMRRTRLREAIVALPTATRLKPATLAAGLELLHGAPRAAVQAKYGLSPDATYRASFRVLAALRKRLVD